jgi:multisubunit Na+/H+ antiporter MnhB subunit
LGLVLIPIIFYTYNGVIGKSPDWINIAIFFIAAAVAYIYETREFLKRKNCRNPRLAIALLCMISVLFIIFTFKTPKIGIFQDPLTGTYGIPLEEASPF